MRKDAVHLSNESVSGVDESGNDIQKSSMAEMAQNYERPKATLSNFIVSGILECLETKRLTITAYLEVWGHTGLYDDGNMYCQCNRCRCRDAHDVLHLWECCRRLYRILYAIFESHKRAVSAGNPSEYVSQLLNIN